MSGKAHTWVDYSEMNAALGRKVQRRAVPVYRCRCCSALIEREVDRNVGNYCLACANLEGGACCDEKVDAGAPL